MAVLQITERAGDHVTGTLPEDVDFPSTPGLRAATDRIIDEGCRHLTLDASHTLHLDSTGITALLIWHQRLEDLGGTLTLTGLNQHLRYLLSRLGLDTILNLTPRTPTTDTPRP
jgi:anti-anti-sigma factor